MMLWNRSNVMPIPPTTTLTLHHSYGFWRRSCQYSRALQLHFSWRMFLLVVSPGSLALFFGTPWNVWPLDGSHHNLHQSKFRLSLFADTLVLGCFCHVYNLHTMLHVSLVTLHQWIDICFSLCRRHGIVRLVSLHFLIQIQFFCFISIVIVVLTLSPYLFRRSSRRRTS